MLLLSPNKICATVPKPAPLVVASTQANANECHIVEIMPSNSAPMGRVSLVLDAEKVKYQLQQLSLEEKVSLLSGSGFATTVAIPRLGIPSLKVSAIVNLDELFMEF